MKVTRIAHVAVAAEALGPAKDIFGGLLGMPLLKEEQFASGTQMAMFDAGNMHVEVLHNASPTSLPGSHVKDKGTGYFHICLEVENLQEALAELAAKGVQVHPNSPRKAAMAGTPVAFLDPAGTGGLLIELAEAH